MKFALLLLINLNFIFSISGQVTWFPYGAKWHYEYGSWGTQGVTILEVLKEDTLIGNNTWKRILSTTLYESNDSLYAYNEFLYVNENDQRVYGFDKWGGYMLYDFNAEEGDTLDMSFGGWSPYPFIVDSIGLRDINGAQLKFQIIRFPSLFEPGEFDKMEVIEGIGSINSHFFHNRTIIQPFDFPTYYFRCYEDENIGLVNLYFPQIDCDYIPGVTLAGTPYENAISIFPNPANDFLILHGSEFENIELSIIDMVGSVRFQQKNTTPDFKRIDVHTLENGIYFLVGQDKSGQILFTNKFSKFTR